MVLMGRATKGHTLPTTGPAKAHHSRVFAPYALKLFRPALDNRTMSPKLLAGMPRVAFHDFLGGQSASSKGDQ